METAILAFFGLVLVILVAVVLKYRRQLSEFVAGVRSEMSKVTWPTQQDVINATVLVFAMTIVLTLATGAVDTVLGTVMRWVMQALV